MTEAQLPDLLYITRHGGNEQVSIRRADGTRETLKLSLPVSSVNRLSIHPDRNQLLLDSLISDADQDSQRWQIMHHDIGSGKTRILKTGALSYVMPIWVENGASIIYVEAHGVGNTPLMKMRADGNVTQPLLSIDGHAAVLSLLCPVLSEDGSTVFTMGFMRHRGPTPECLLYTAQVVNGDLVPIGSRGISGFFDLSPDGTRIARVDKGNMTLLNVHSFESETISLSQTIDEAIDHAAVWSDNGRYIAASYGKTLFIIDMSEKFVVERISGLARPSAFTWFPTS